MKITPVSEPQQTNCLSEDLVNEIMGDDMLPEYDIDYSKARPNRFAARLAQTRMVQLEPDVAAVFTTQDDVNSVLRALIQTMPNTSHH